MATDPLHAQENLHPRFGSTGEATTVEAASSAVLPMASDHNLWGVWCTNWKPGLSMQVCTCICTYIYMYICISVYTYICFTYASLSIYLFVYVCVYVYIHMYMWHRHWLHVCNVCRKVHVCTPTDTHAQEQHIHMDVLSMCSNVRALLNVNLF